MSTFLAVLLYFGLTILEIFLGAWFVADAVRSFKRERYWLFGVNVMLAIYCAARLVQLTFIQF